MNKHFYLNKKVCQTRLNNIDLTEDIKQHIILNRRYIVPKREENVLNKTVNNYNTLNNFVVQMDAQSKINKLLNYNNAKQIDFEEGIEKRFQNRIKRLEDRKYKAAFTMDLSSLFNVINMATKVESDNLENFNVFFDRKLGRLGIYRDGEWESFIEEIGLRELVSIIKSYYLDTYELYLIRNLHHEDSLMNRVVLLQHLEIYYQFIGTFELSPAILGTEDCDLLGHQLMEGNEHYLEETYMTLYKDQIKGTKKAEKSCIKKQLSKIVKDNTTHNIDQLNKVILEILKIDGQFRETLLNEFSLRKQSDDAQIGIVQ
jgi:hypothetical protein